MTIPGAVHVMELANQIQDNMWLILQTNFKNQLHSNSYYFVTIIVT